MLNHRRKNFSPSCFESLFREIKAGNDSRKACQDILRKFSRFFPRLRENICVMLSEEKFPHVKVERRKEQRSLRFEWEILMTFPFLILWKMRNERARDSCRDGKQSGAKRKELDGRNLLKRSKMKSKSAYYESNKKPEEEGDGDKDKELFIAVLLHSRPTKLYCSVRSSGDVLW